MIKREIRRNLLSLVSAFVLFTGIAWSQSPSDWAEKLELLDAYPDVVVVNAKIATLDKNNSEAEAMAIRNHRILALGTSDEIMEMAGPNTEILDIEGRRLIPGLVDGHTHPTRFASDHWLGEEAEFMIQQYNDPQLKIAFAFGNTQEEIIAALEKAVAERAQELGPGKWIWVNLFGGSSLSESRQILPPLFPRYPDDPNAVLSRSYLDRIAPSNPLMVATTEAIGPGMNNSLARREWIKVRGEELFGLAARGRIVYDIFLRNREEDIIDFITRELETCILPHGITTFSDYYSGSPQLMNAFRTMYERDELPVRWAYWDDLGNKIDERYEFHYNQMGDIRGIGNDYIWNAGVGTEGWEQGLICTTATPIDADAQKPNRGGGNLSAGLRPECSEPANFDELPGYWNVKKALEAGLRVGYLHAYSDGTYDALIQLLDEMIDSGRMTMEQVRNLKITLEHNPMVRPDQVAKLVNYGVVLGFNGYQVQGNIKGGAFLKIYGESYMNWIAPMKSLVDAGSHPVFNTDAHLHKSTKTNPWNVRMDYPPSWVGSYWAYLEFFATRYMRDNGMTYNALEALDRTTLLKAATIWGAEALLKDEDIGSLEQGKLADFAVLDKDYFGIPLDEIHTIQNLMTVVGGKVVWKSENF
jgi:predicted amidohydrolase YtcJ